MKNMRLKLDSVERRNVISLILVLLFFTTVIEAVYHTRLSWEDAKYAMISKNSPLVKELLKEHPDAKYTVEEAEFYQEMYPHYRRFEHLWDPSRGTRLVVYYEVGCLLVDEGEERKVSQTRSYDRHLAIQ